MGRPANVTALLDDTQDRKGADPAAAMAPHVGNPRLLTASPGRRAASTADLAPPTMRPGSEAALACPTRVGNRLHHRCGRVTDMAGNPITPSEIYT